MTLALWQKILLSIALFLALQAGILWLFGQPPICTCGYVKIWEGVVFSIGNSQHISDWYTFSHIIHGFLFYLAATLIFPKSSILQRIVIALGIEVAWEIAENTPWVINKYREQALAVGYTGDSILNSISDTLAMAFGFYLARRLPVWSVIALAITLEVIVAIIIRDNLTLNILNFIYQFEFIHRWQSG